MTGCDAADSQAGIAGRKVHVGDRFRRKADPARRSATAAEGAPDLNERLAWPTAALLILLLSAGLWFGIAMLLNTLVG